VDRNFDQTGSTYDGRLFYDNPITAGMVPNPVIKYVDGKPDRAAMLDVEINRLYLTTRAQNILTKTGCKTYGDALKFGREPMSKLRNVGVTTISELDAEFDRVGLWNQWKYNKPIA
jgi:DNA-directed RNA polymerase alpha subunit